MNHVSRSKVKVTLKGQKKKPVCLTQNFCIISKTLINFFEKLDRFMIWIIALEFPENF